MVLSDQSIDTRRIVRERGEIRIGNVVDQRWRRRFMQSLNADLGFRLKRYTHVSMNGSVLAKLMTMPRYSRQV